MVTRLAYLHAHEDRGTSDSINTSFLRPLRYDEAGVAGAINKRYGRFWTSLGARRERGQFRRRARSPASRSSRTIVTAPWQLCRFASGYVVAPLTSVFVEVAPNHRDFRCQMHSTRPAIAWSAARCSSRDRVAHQGRDLRRLHEPELHRRRFPGRLDIYLRQLARIPAAPNLTATLEGRRDAREASLSGGVFAGVPGDGVSVVEIGRSAGRCGRCSRTSCSAPASPTSATITRRRRSDERQPAGLDQIFRQSAPHAGLRLPLSTFDSSGLGVLGYYQNVYLFSAN